MFMYIRRLWIIS